MPPSLAVRSYGWRSLWEAAAPPLQRRRHRLASRAARRRARRGGRACRGPPTCENERRGAGPPPPGGAAGYASVAPRPPHAIVTSVDPLGCVHRTADRRDHAHVHEQRRGVHHGQACDAEAFEAASRRRLQRAACSARRDRRPRWTATGRAHHPHLRAGSDRLLREQGGVAAARRGAQAAPQMAASYKLSA